MPANVGINLLTPMFESKSTDENNSQLINLYLNQDNYQGKSQIVAYPTPGVSGPFVTINSPVRALYNMHGNLYAVGGNTLYSISSAGVATSLGTLNSSTGWCKIRAINEALFILDTVNGYSYTFATGALANLQSGSTISSIAVTNGGSQYASANVGITDPTGSGATATATVVGGVVTSIAVTAAGSNYTNPVISITPPGSGATATANLSTSLVPIATLALTNAGIGYMNPTINITDSTGTSATATIGVPANSGVCQHTTINGTDSQVQNTGTISSCTFSVVDNSNKGSGATVAGITFSEVNGYISIFYANAYITNGGSNYITPKIKVTIASQHYNGSFITGSCGVALVANSGLLQASTLVLTNMGSGYTNPTITVVDSNGSGGVITATLASNTISSFTVTAGGSGYGTTVPSVTITDTTGKGCTATAHLTTGSVSSITVNSGGVNFTSPTVNIISTGSGATATATLSSSSFPAAVNDIECQDEFGLAITQNAQTIYSSTNSTLATWPALNVASTTGQQGLNIALASFQRYLYILGDYKSEIWSNQGLFPFAFQRVTNAYIECGCVSAATVVTDPNSIFFLGRHSSGGIQVYQITNQEPTIISLQINYILNTYSVISDAYAFLYTQEGEEFYVLTFPTQGITWAYSLLTQQWHIRQSVINGSLSRWFPSSYVYSYGMPLVGDSQSGSIYQLSTSQYTENGNPITRTLITHPYYAEGAAVTCYRFQVDFDQTPGSSLSQVNLYVSRDGGYTFGAAKPATPVQTPDGQWRCYWTRLGRARSWVFKIQTTINNKIIILGAWAQFAGETTDSGNTL